MAMLDNYERFLGELSKASAKNFKNVNSVPSQEAINNVILSEQNAILKQIGVALAIIADELHKLIISPRTWRRRTARRRFKLCLSK